MPMKMITEKRISEKIILNRIPDVAKLYLKKKFIIDLLTNWFIILTFLEHKAILNQLTGYYRHQVKLANEHKELRKETIINELEHGLDFVLDHFEWFKNLDFILICRYLYFFKLSELKRVIDPINYAQN